MKELTKEIHDMAKQKGWWDTPRTPLEIHMLIVSEIAEATECVRDRQKDLWFDEENEDKPQGERSELADAVIRIMDYYGHKGWDLESDIREKVKYNSTRSNRHGGKAA